MCWVYERIDYLSTPCGKILITDERGQSCKFSVKPNSYNVDYNLYSGTEDEIILKTDTNYSICINTADLELGQIYKIRLEGGRLHYGDSDERTVCVSGTYNGYSIAIGAYDPNEDEKLHQACDYSDKQGLKQIVYPPEYDESRFTEYDVEMLEDCSGFSFRLIDRSREWIYFPVAWIENDYNTNLEEYESAVEFWTT